MSQSLIDNLRSDPTGFTLWQAVRTLLHAARKDGHGLAAARLDDLVETSGVALQAGVSVASPDSDIVASGTSDEGHTLDVTLFGLLTTDGIMPQQYIAAAFANDRHTGSLTEFLALFEQRLFELLIAAWGHSNTAFAFEIAQKRRSVDRVTDTLLHLAGFPPGAVETLRHEFVETGSDETATDETGNGRVLQAQRVDTVNFVEPDLNEVLCRYIGHFHQITRSPDDLANILSDVFGLDCRIVPFDGEWLHIDTADATFMGGSHSRLGHDTTAGNRFWDASRGFRVVLRTIDEDSLPDFLPAGTNFELLVALVELSTRADWFRVELHTDRDPNVPMDISGDDPPRLGWTTFMPCDDDEHTHVVEPVVIANAARFRRAYSNTRSPDAQGAPVFSVGS